jgi:hypothetical protein
MLKCRQLTARKEFKMEVFDINKYKGKYVMHTVTKEQYDEFCAYLDSIGKRWISGESFAEEYTYDTYKEDTCINFNLDTATVAFRDVEFYKTLNHTILEMENFIMPKKKFTKADLKTGDFVKLRDGYIGIVNTALGAIVYTDGNGSLDNYTNELQCSLFSDCDIVAVSRPMEKRDFTFEIFERKFGTLIYEREEVEEMTLEQICKLLGKNIKIVKG